MAIGLGAADDRRKDILPVGDGTLTLQSPGAPGHDQLSFQLARSQTS